MSLASKTLLNTYLEHFSISFSVLRLTYACTHIKSWFTIYCFGKLIEYCYLQKAVKCFFVFVTRLYLGRALIQLTQHGTKHNSICKKSNVRYMQGVDLSKESMEEVFPYKLASFSIDKYMYISNRYTSRYQLVYPQDECCAKSFITCMYNSLQSTNRSCYRTDLYSSHSPKKNSSTTL